MFSIRHVYRNCKLVTIGRDFFTAGGAWKSIHECFRHAEAKGEAVRLIDRKNRQTLRQLLATGVFAPPVFDQRTRLFPLIETAPAGFSPSGHSFKTNRTMRLLITEEALDNARGHFLEYIKDIVSECDNQEIEPVVAVHRNADEDVTSQLPTIRVHPVNVWNSRTNGSANRIVRILRVFQHNFRLARALRKAIREHGPFDCVLAPTNLVDHTLGHYLVARWLQRNNADTHYVLIFVDSVGVHDADGNLHFPRRTGLLRRFIRLFERLQQEGRATLCVETPEMGRHYHRFSGLRFEVVPHVVQFDTADLDRRRDEVTRDEIVAFGSFGFARFDKGTDILQEAVRLIFEKTPEFETRFFIQWNRDFDFDDGRTATISPTLRENPLVHYITEVFDKDAYLDYLARTDIVVLPYRRFFYRERLSRVAIDAAIAGIPFIAPEGTWLSRFQEKYGAGLTFEPERPESLAEMIREARKQSDDLKARARSRMKAAAEAFGPEAFLRRIKEFCGQQEKQLNKPASASDERAPSQ